MVRPSETGTTAVIRHVGDERHDPAADLPLATAEDQDRPVMGFGTLRALAAHQAARPPGRASTPGRPAWRAAG